MADPGPAMKKFSKDLKALWVAAGVSHRMFTAESSKVKIPRSTLSGWMNEKGVPSQEWTKPFFALIRDLDERAAKKGHAQRSLTEAQWQILLSAAREERARNRGGRRQTTSPGRTSVPGATSPAVQAERDRVFREHDAWVETFRADLLMARENEIRELERFCTGPLDGDRSAYLWWQAGPWAGKTALLAEFAMRHRPPGVEIVSCFITERLGNNTREEFLAEIGPQLAAVAGRGPLRSSVGARALPELFDAAAQACGQRGQRLLLVVDGLDEDGLDKGRSIAALLPKSPPAGMLVVVAGRPNPPLPSDVPADHPLRMPGAVRALKPSPDAEVMSAMAERDLHELLQDQVGSGLLAVVTVARGGLTGRDLAELTGVRPHDIDMRLHRITGRGLLPEKSGYLPAPDADTRRYILGHDELYRTARAKLGKTATDEAEQRLHRWAGTYQEAGWPADTPDYLLYTYPVLLTRTGEQHRLSDLALAPRRQTALVHRSSADAALSQLDRARRGIAHSGAPDLGTLAALAASREMLTEGARALPPSLAEALARLGHADRAVEVARAAAFPADKACRLATLAGVLAETGHPNALRVAQEAAAWAAQARTEAESGDEYDAEVATGEAAVALVQAGQDEGLDLLATLHPPSWSGDETLPCVMLARASLAVRPRSADRAEELLDQAEHSADQIDEPSDPASAVTAWAAIGDAASPARAARAHARVLEHVDAFPPGLTGAYVCASAASALAKGRPEAAAELAGRAALQVAEAMAVPGPPAGEWPDRWDLENALLATVRALVNLGAVEQASSLIASVPEALRRSVRVGDIRVAALALLEAPRTAEEAAQQAAALALEGRIEEAERQLAEAIDTAPLYVASPREVHLEFLARALALTGQFTDAEALAAGMADGPRQVRALAAVALQAAAAGRLPEAGRLAHQAADRSRDLPGAGNFTMLAGAPGSRVAAAQASAAQALARAGDRDAALALAEEITQVKASAGSQAFIAVAAGLRFHDAATAVRLVDRERERLTSNPKKTKPRFYELVELLTAIADADQPCTARIEQAIEDAYAASGLAELEPEDKLVLSVLEARNQPEAALALLAQAERSMAAAPPGYMEPAAFAVGYAVFGDYDEARRAALDNPAPLSKAVALTAVADYLIGNEPSHRSTSQSASDAHGRILRSLALLVAPVDAGGMPETAADLIREALAEDGWYHALPALARIAPEAVERVRDVVFAHRRLPSTPRPAAVPSP